MASESIAHEAEGRMGYWSQSQFVSGFAQNFKQIVCMRESHSAFQTWQRQSMLERKRLTSGWRASLKNAFA